MVLCVVSRRKKYDILIPALILKGEDGCSKLLDGPYSFIKDKEFFNRTYWRCEYENISQCPARITTRNGLIESK